MHRLGESITRVVLRDIIKNIYFCSHVFVHVLSMYKNQSVQNENLEIYLTVKIINHYFGSSISFNYMVDSCYKKISDYISKKRDIQSFVTKRSIQKFINKTAGLTEIDHAINRLSLIM